VDQITGWLDAVEEKTGARPSKMILNRNTFKLLRKNTQIRENMLPLGVMASASLQSNAVITDMQLEATFKALTGLSEIMVYNQKVQMDGIILDLIEDNKVAFVVEGELGNTMIGTSPAELNMAEANQDGANIVVMGNGLAVNTYMNNKAPYTSGTELEFVGLPSFLSSDRVVLATVA
ncbi:MAG: major capsid protein, partial [Fusobacteriaceae bacterium]